jgi:hypothetical protein
MAATDFMEKFYRRPASPATSPLWAAAPLARRKLPTPPRPVSDEARGRRSAPWPTSPAQIRPTPTAAPRWPPCSHRLALGRGLVKSSKARPETAAAFRTKACHRRVTAYRGRTERPTYGSRDGSSWRPISLRVPRGAAIDRASLTDENKRLSAQRNRP